MKKKHQLPPDTIVLVEARKKMSLKAYKELREGLVKKGWSVLAREV